MDWKNHTESQNEDGSILIETMEDNILDSWFLKRVQMYHEQGKKVHTKVLKRKVKKHWPKRKETNQGKEKGDLK